MGEGVGCISSFLDEKSGADYYGFNYYPPIESFKIYGCFSLHRKHPTSEQTPSGRTKSSRPTSTTNSQSSPEPTNKTIASTLPPSRDHNLDLLAIMADIPKEVPLNNVQVEALVRIFFSRGAAFKADEIHRS